MGYANVDEMLDGMTSIQVSEWMAYFRLRDRRTDESEEERKKAAKAAAKAKENAGG